MSNKFLISFCIVFVGAHSVTIASQVHQSWLSRGQEQQLKTAIMYGEALVVRTFFERGLINANHVDLSGIYRPFLGAAEWGREDIVRMFLEYGADMHQVDCYGMTALMCAATYNYKTIVRMLLLHGMKADKKNFADQIGKQTARLSASEESARTRGAALIEDVQSGISRTIMKSILSRDTQLPTVIYDIVLGYVGGREETLLEQQETISAVYFNSPLASGSRTAGQKIQQALSHK